MKTTSQPDSGSAVTRKWASGLWAHTGFRISGVGFLVWISRFQFQVSGFRFFWGFGFQFFGVWVQVLGSGIGFQVLGFGEYRVRGGIDGGNELVDVHLRPGFEIQVPSSVCNPGFLALVEIQAS